MTVITLRSGWKISSIHLSPSIEDQRLHGCTSSTPTKYHDASMPMNDAMLDTTSPGAQRLDLMSMLTSVDNKVVDQVGQWFQSYRWGQDIFLRVITGYSWRSKKIEISARSTVVEALPRLPLPATELGDRLSEAPRSTT